MSQFFEMWLWNVNKTKNLSKIHLQMVQLTIVSMVNAAIVYEFFDVTNGFI